MLELKKVNNLNWSYSIQGLESQAKEFKLI